MIPRTVNTQVSDIRLCQQSGNINFFALNNLLIIFSYYSYSLLYLSIVAPAICKYLNSPLHFVKISGGGNYHHNFALEEYTRNYKGRKIEVKRINDKLPNVNYISVNDDDVKKRKPYDEAGIDKNTDKYSENMIDSDIIMVDDSEIVRPGISFLSNARPAVMAWREVEMEETPIIKPSKQQKQSNRLKKKYSGRVPVHLGYSRNLVDYTMPSLPIFQKRKYRFPESTLVWLQPTSFNGLPQKLLHMRPLLKMRKLNEMENNHIMSSV